MPSKPYCDNFATLPRHGTSVDLAEIHKLVQRLLQRGEPNGELLTLHQESGGRVLATVQGADLGAIAVFEVLVALKFRHGVNC